MRDDDLGALKRRYQETGAAEDRDVLESALFRAGRAGYVVSPENQRFGPSQGVLRQAIQDDNSGLSALLHPRAVLADGTMVYRMLRSDEVMVACLADPLLLKKRRWSGASFVTSASDSKFEVRPGCPFLVNVEARDGRYVWSLGDLDGVLGPVGARRGEEGRDYWVCDRSDERYSTNLGGYRRLPKAQVKSLGAWIALAGGDVKLLSDFAELQYSVLKLEYGRDGGMGCWVSEQDGLRAVAFGLINNDGDAVGSYFSSLDFTEDARFVRVAPIIASPQGEPQV